MAHVRKMQAHERESVLAIVNEAARAYRGVIPDDRWHDPYMSAAEFDGEIAAGVEFWCYVVDQQILGVMGLQHVKDVALIRHAYVRTSAQRRGVGAVLLTHLRTNTTGRILVGTWAAADWAIAFYQRHGFKLVPKAITPELLQRYWRVPQRQIEESVVLASPHYVTD
jgi:GNAT superfamily N-acetyltransferase